MVLYFACFYCMRVVRFQFIASGNLFMIWGICGFFWSFVSFLVIQTWKCVRFIYSFTSLFCFNFLLMFSSSASDAKCCTLLLHVAMMEKWVIFIFCSCKSSQRHIQKHVLDYCLFAARASDRNRSTLLLVVGVTFHSRKYCHYRGDNDTVAA